MDNEPAPVENRSEILKQERLALAAAKKKKFQDELSAKLLHLNLDHCYSSSVGDANDEGKKLQASRDLVDQFFQSHVCLDPGKVTELERSTQLQHCCEAWHNERKFRITASIMKEVSHRKDTTSCHAFIQRKLMPKQIDNKAVRYGKSNEELAIKACVNCLRKDDRIVNISKCGLFKVFIDPSEPWLAASPDGIAVETTLSSQNKGCLKVKCPLVCEKTAFVDSCKSVTGFCLLQCDGRMQLSKSHGYHYQIQTQMHTTHFPWSDFVVWSPTQEPFVQHVSYDAGFMTTAIIKARNFYLF